MMAASGTPTVAPVSGRVEHRGSSLGGLSWYVYGDNGHTYYGTHLSGYANQGVGWVAAGTVIGYVGQQRERVGERAAPALRVPPWWRVAGQPLSAGGIRLPQPLTGRASVCYRLVPRWGAGVGDCPSARAALGDRMCRRGPGVPAVGRSRRTRGSRRPSPGGPGRRRHQWGGGGRQSGTGGRRDQPHDRRRERCGRGARSDRGQRGATALALDAAEAGVAAAVKQLGARAAAVVETQGRI